MLLLAEHGLYTYSIGNLRTRYIHLIGKSIIALASSVEDILLTNTQIGQTRANR